MPCNPHIYNIVGVYVHFQLNNTSANEQSLIAKKTID